MSSELEIVFAVIGTGVAVVMLNMIQISGLRRDLRSDMAELRSEMAGLRSDMVELCRELELLRERIARLEGVLDIIQTSMQLPRLDVNAEDRSKL